MLLKLRSNVMIADDGVTPILMDFGSTVKARVDIESRSYALLQQVTLWIFGVLQFSHDSIRILQQNRVRWLTVLPSYLM